MKSNVIKDKRKRKILFRCILALILAMMILRMAQSFLSNPRVKMLLSIIHFTESTLEDPGYLAYGVDMMELFHDYSNADTEIIGKIGMNHVKRVNTSMYMEMDAIRSFDQRKFRADATLDILTLEAGEISFYAQDETVYLDAPIMGEFAYAFPTGIDLFQKMPDLTSDIDREWFREHKSDIVTLMQQMDIEATGDTITAEDGTVSIGYEMTIHEGDGHFVWELLGMEDPDYDITSIVYLTKNNHLTRMELDLSHSIEGAYMVLEGDSLGTLVCTYELPDSELATFTLVRSADHMNRIDATLVYDTNIGTQYVMEGAIKWTDEDEGFSLHVNDIAVTLDGELLANAYFVGTVKPIEVEENIFEGKEDELHGMEELDWKAIRNDADGFIQGILDKMKGTLFGISGTASNE